MKAVVALLTLIAAVTLHPERGTAQTIVSPKGNEITVTIKVDIFASKDLQSTPDGTPLDEAWARVLNDSWGDAFGRHPYKNCYKLSLKLDIALKDINDKARSGAHKIYVKTGAQGWTGVGWDGAPETIRNPKTGDGTRSYEQPRSGDIPYDAPPTVVAHEFGHIMGLGDDRANGKAKEGREGTLMVGGVPGVDPNVLQEIDQDLVNRIGEVIRKDLDRQGKKLPPCEQWHGSLESQHTVTGACSFTWTGSYEFGVVKHQVLGTGTITPSSCGLAGPVTIDGTADDDGFTLGSDSYLLAAGTRIEKTDPRHAKGTSEYHDAYNDVVTTFTMECKKGCEEPVG
jgi:hypothetical protein